MVTRAWLPEPGYQSLATRAWLPEPGYQSLATRAWLPEPGYQSLATRAWRPETGDQSPATRAWLPEPGYQSLATRAWLPEPGYQSQSPVTRARWPEPGECSPVTTAWTVNVTELFSCGGREGGGGEINIPVLVEEAVGAPLIWKARPASEVQVLAGGSLINYMEKKNSILNSFQKIDSQHCIIMACLVANDNEFGVYHNHQCRPVMWLNALSG